jgi:hypothetical protein
MCRIGGALATYFMQGGGDSADSLNGSTTKFGIGVPK